MRDEDVELAWARHLQRTEAVEVSLLAGALEASSLAGAQCIARERHLLRAAVERQLAHAPEQRAAKQKPARRGGGGGGGGAAAAASAALAEMDGGRSGGAMTGLSRLVGAMVSDAAKGRTLLNSDALAAAEVARQLRLPLSVMATRAPAEMHDTSWYTRAHMRLAELERRLLSAKVALRSRVASEGGAAALAAGEDAEALRWAAGAAGVRLTQPTPLQTVYNALHAPPTHVVPRYANTLDWICVDAQRLEVVSVAPRPPLQALTRDVAMPSAEWPSDHVSLCCDLAWRT